MLGLRSMSRGVCLIGMALAATFAIATPVQAEKRAFVAGIDRYATVQSLKTAVADSAAMASKLEGLGFKVTRLKDATQAEFDAGWAEFVGSLKPHDDVVFYFGGHGIQVDGANYLLPRNAVGIDAGQSGVIERSIDFTQLVEAIQARQPRVAVLVLDACRNDPFKSKGQAKAKWLQSKGLARLETIYNTFIMYSAGANEEAIDEPPAGGTNSIYVHHLLPLIGKSDLSMVDVAKRVQVTVADETRKSQNPAYFDGIIGQYYLGTTGAAATITTGVDSIVSPKVLRLGGFATWDAECQSRPAPRIQVIDPPKLGRIMLRYEGFDAAGTHFGKTCAKSKQRGVGVYFVVDDGHLASTAVDKVRFAVKHWSVAPTTSVEETFEVDLATRYTKRITARQ